MTTICKIVSASVRCEHCLSGNARGMLDMTTNKFTADNVCLGCGALLCDVCSQDKTPCRCEPEED